MATYQFVPEHNGIEIYFDTKPSEEILDELRGNGWRWHRVKECWFTKKSDAAKALAKRLCGQSGIPAAGAQSSTITIQQSIDSTFVSTLTIHRDNQGCSVSSTNNQIVCCDCRRFFSIHADACPFCGCPLSYIAEHYSKAYDPMALRQRECEESKRKGEEQKRIRTEVEEQEKLQFIESIARERDDYWLVYWRLKCLSKVAFNRAAERIKLLKELNAPISLTDYPYLELITESNKFFGKAFGRAKQIKKFQNELPTIRDKEWEYLLSLNETEFNERICVLKAKQKAALEKAEKISLRRKQEEYNQKEIVFNDLCSKYHIEAEQLAILIEKYGTKEQLLQKLQIIDNIGGEYRHKINVLGYIDSPEILKQLVKTLR